MKDCCEKWAKMAPVFIRVTLGLFFLFSGINKVTNPEGFLGFVQSIGFFEPGSTFENLYVAILPWAEILAGAAAALGFMTRWAAGLMSLLLLSFIIAMGFFTKAPQFNKDVVLLGASLSLMLTGSNFFSIDQFMCKNCKK